MRLIPHLCSFQGNSGQDSQQRGAKGETGDIGPVVQCSAHLDPPCAAGLGGWPRPGSLPALGAVDGGLEAVGA